MGKRLWIDAFPPSPSLSKTRQYFLYHIKERLGGWEEGSVYPCLFKMRVAIKTLSPTNH